MAAVNFGWTDEHNMDLRRRFDAGESMRVMAAAFGLSPGAIVGKLHRMGLKRGHSRKQAGDLGRAKQKKNREERRYRRPRVPMPPIERAPAPQFTCAPVPLLELQPGQCRFEVTGADDPAKYLFCGNPVAGEGISWCPEHCRVVFVHGDKWQSIGDVARRIVKGLK